MDLKPLLWPKSIAVIGASSDTTNLRGRLFAQILRHGYPGSVHPVSRTHTEIAGIACVGTVGELPAGIDLAVISAPAEHVEQLLGACAERRVKAALIVSSGFSDLGSSEGVERQHRVAVLAQRYGMSVCGPNAEGFINARLPLVATFSPAVLDAKSHALPAGAAPGTGIALLTQSGGVGYGCYDRGRDLGLAFTYVVAVGNQAALDLLQIADYILEDSGTGVVAMVIEAFKDPSLFAAVARKASAAGKLLLVAKMGRSQSGARAAASHSGTIAGSGASYDAIFKHWGVLTANDMDEFVDLMAASVLFRDTLPRGRNVAVLTPSGGAGIWLADLCEAQGLQLPAPADSERAALHDFLPEYASLENPIDITAQGVIKDGYARSLAILAASTRYDSLVVACTTIRTTLIERDLPALLHIRQSTGKPIIFCSYTGIDADIVSKLASVGIPCFTNMRTTGLVIRQLADASMAKSSVQMHPPIAGSAPLVSPTAADLSGLLCEYEIKQVLGRFGVIRFEGRLARSAEEAAALVESLGVPAALKIQSPQIPHKTEAQGVELQVAYPAQAQIAYQKLMARAEKYSPGADLRGVLIERMAAPGVEMIIGIHRDADFGLMLLLGAGGIFVELYRDTVLLPLAADEASIRRALESLLIYPRLKGFRGDPPADIDALLALLRQLVAFVEMHSDQIADLDLNPVRIHPSGFGLSVLDALLVPAKPDHVTSFSPRQSQI